MVRLDLLGLEQQGGPESDLQGERTAHDRHVRHATARSHGRLLRRPSIGLHGRRRQAPREIAEERVRGGGDDQVTHQEETGDLG